MEVLLAGLFASAVQALLTVLTRLLLLLPSLLLSQVLQ
jgi:hypothetical protein